jgi:glycine/D-amino acid oxidase-like deaminating enzyme
MNVGDEASRSFWMETAPAIEASPLAANAQCDVVVVGSGIAGLSTAYELARFERRVIVIDRGRVGRGMTARTTAHLATELDDFYSELIRVRAEQEARIYYDSRVAAVNRIEAICREEGIDADFARVDGYLMPAEESHRADLEEEYDACRSIGVDVEWVDRAPMPGLDSGPALRFPNQGRFHPSKYLAGLACAITARGGRLHSDTAYLGQKEFDGGVEIETEAGHKVRAAAAVFATNSPVNDKVFLGEGGGHEGRETMRRPLLLACADTCAHQSRHREPGRALRDVGPHPVAMRTKQSLERYGWIRPEQSHRRRRRDG